MNRHEIDTILSSAEAQIAIGEVPQIRGTGFWAAVGATKKDPALIDEFADRIAVIDLAAFNAWARLVVPVRVGTGVALLGVLVGLVLLWAAVFVDQWNAIVFLAGAGALIGSTHGLGHLVAGRLAGIRFSGWFVGRGRPQPGVKTDYSTYLRASANGRAWMHASGAIVTKAVPLLLLPIAMLATAVPTWVAVVLTILGVFQIATDILWSTKSSDWAKFTRERSLRNG